MRGESGLATLETTLMITILIPLLFAVIEFGDVFQRWLAQESATVQVARYAGELGGDAPEVRALLDGSLRSSGIDPSAATVDVTPARVGWREPLTVTVRTNAMVAIPFLFSAAIPLRTSAVVRGELAR
ncbi:MAG TPA: TadE/TadG family type IV pilus assembly protein [Candidatus Saccharimonadales bacterium]|nr:TadE/TadG family type IV pilus assembly protein [Candidatus Saccharimonadales bacterium]